VAAAHKPTGERACERGLEGNPRTPRSKQEPSSALTGGSAARGVTWGPGSAFLALDAAPKPLGSGIVARLSGVDVADGRKPRAVKHPGGVVGEQADLAVDVRAVDYKLQRCGVGVVAANVRFELLGCGGREPETASQGHDVVGVLGTLRDELVASKNPSSA